MDLGPGPAPTTDWLSQSQTVDAYAFTQGGPFPRESSPTPSGERPGALRHDRSRERAGPDRPAASPARVPERHRLHRAFRRLPGQVSVHELRVRPDCSLGNLLVSGPAAIAFKVDYSYSVTGTSGDVDQAYVYLLMQASFSTPTGAGNSSSVDSKTFNSFSDGARRASARSTPASSQVGPEPAPFSSSCRPTPSPRWPPSPSPKPGSPSWRG